MGPAPPLAAGQALLNPSAQLTDAIGDMIVTKAQLSAKLAGSYPQVWLLAIDNTAPRLRDGHKRSLSPGTPGNPQPFTFFLPASPYSFTATSASPAVFTAVGSSYANWTPRTTMRHGRTRQNLDRYPNYILAAYIASGT